MSSKLKVLFYDIEITPRTLGDAWFTMGAANSFLVTFGYRWGHEKKTHYIDLTTTNTLHKLDPFNDTCDKEVVKAAHKIMSEADILVAHYGNKFDWKYMNAKFEKNGLGALTHIPKRDTCLQARRVYKIGSNTLRRLAEFFGGAKKTDIDKRHWFALYTRSKASMKLISEYCAGKGDSDVNALYDIYKQMEKHFPVVYHVGVMVGKHKALSCPACASSNLIRRGTYTKPGGGKYIRVSCHDCGKWTNTGLTAENIRAILEGK